MQSNKPKNTFGLILAKNRGVGSGFDLLRLGLALLILLCHMSSIIGHTGGMTAWIYSLISGNTAVVADHAPTAALSPARIKQVVETGQPIFVNTGISGPFIRGLVPMFFALSGFLVAGSAFRTSNVLRFLGLRALRIVPALLVEVFLSAVVLGAIFTTLPLREYFTHPQFFAYFLNVIGDIHFFLPGVFKQNGSHVVNANLWTLPSEFESYLLMSVIMITGLIKARKITTVLFSILTVIAIISCFKYEFNADVGIASGRVLVYYFICGIMIYLWRDKVPFHPAIFAVCIVASYTLLSLKYATFFTPFFLTYVTIFIGLIEMPQSKILKSGDYSYGIYLYSYPVSQALVTALGSDRFSFITMTVLSVVGTLGFSVFSWHAIEKHCLKLKRYISPKSANITKALHPNAVVERGSASDVAATIGRSSSAPIDSA